MQLSYKKFLVQNVWLSTLVKSVASSEKLDGVLEVNKVTSAHELKALGDSYAEVGDWQASINAYNKALALEPENSSLYECLGDVFNQQDNWEDAAAAFTKALSLNPKSAWSYNKLGDIFVQQSKWEDAATVFLKTIELMPDFSWAHHKLGDALAHQNSYEKAIAAYLKAAELNEDSELTYNNLGDVYFSEGQWDKAADAYAKVIELNPKLSDAYHKLGDALFQQDVWDEAIQAYENAIALNPNFSWSYNNLGDVLRTTQNWEAASDAYNRAIELNPDYAWTYYNLGDVLTHLEHWENAIDAYRNAHSKDDSLPGLQQKLAYVLSNRAKADLENAFDLHSQPYLFNEYRKLDGALDSYQKEIMSSLWRYLDTDKQSDISVEDRKKTDTKDVNRWPYITDADIIYPSTRPDGSPWPKISIITPSYNQGKFVEETILSVINQNYPNIEHIFIDGGSTDETMEIVHQYQEHLTYIVSESDRGQSHALNKGFSRATGEIFTWLNSDDCFAPGALYAIALGFYASGADIVAGICELFKDGVKIGTHLTSCKNGKLSLKEILDVENNWLTGKFFYQPEIMFSKALWERAGAKINESLYYVMDYELWSRFATAGARIEVIGTPIAQYRLHDEQKTSTVDKYRPELLKTRNKIRKQFDLGSGLINRIGGAIQRKDTLNIVFFNDVGNKGGAGIAHQRIAQAFARAGHHVSFIAGTLDWALTPADCVATEVLDRVSSLNPDVVIAGNIHNTKFPVDILEKLVNHFPTIFVMHDQWLTTGRCAYTGACKQFLESCDAGCPTSQSYPALDAEEIFDTFHRKLALLGHDNLFVVGDSQWLTDWARDVAFTHADKALHHYLEKKIQPIYYGLDLDVFKPADKIECRQKLDLPEDRFIIITGCQSLKDKRKGFSYLLSALEMVNLSDVLLVCFGDKADVKSSVDIRYTGFINNPLALAWYYAAADIFVGPSLEEAFGQTFIEAAACGTPAIGFDVGGVREAITDNISGYIVKEKSPEALAQAISHTYYNQERLDLLSQTAPIHIKNLYSFQRSYQTFITSFDKGGWLDKLNINAITKFTSHSSNAPTPQALVSNGHSIDSEIIAGDKIDGFTLSGFSHIQPHRPDLGILGSSQWILCPGGKFVIHSEHVQSGQLSVSFRNIASNQSIKIRHEENELMHARISSEDINVSQLVSVSITLQEGYNFIDIIPATYHQDDSNLLLGILLEKISFQSEKIFHTSMPLKPVQLSQKLISFGDELKGSGWFPAEKSDNTFVRWMTKEAVVLVQGIDLKGSLTLTIEGISFASPDVLETLEVRVNGCPIIGSVARINEKQWFYTGEIIQESMVQGNTCLVSLTVGHVRQLSPTDHRKASLLVKSIFLSHLK